MSRGPSALVEPAEILFHRREVYEESPLIGNCSHAILG
jgi:hypothetical protein